LAGRTEEGRVRVKVVSPLLDVQGLRVTYGGINAVKGIDLHVGTGELVALIGANGAGKTSTLKAIAGVLAPAAGRVIYAGQDVTHQPSFRLVQQGLALVPEGRGIFPQLSVAENLQMGAYCRPHDARIGQDLERVYGLFQRLHERRAQKAGTLSGGEQQMLAIGRALMSRPKLLLLDEPSMGLAPMMVQKIFETIVQVAREGVTTLLVEQNARLALQVSQRAYVLDSGAITLQGQASELLHDPKVREAYLGE
jgi:branched-chain amino acid transport system ATP-binding protein